MYVNFNTSQQQFESNGDLKSYCHSCHERFFLRLHFYHLESILRASTTTQSILGSICVAHFLCASLQKHSSKMFAVVPHFELVPAHFKNINGELDAVVC